MIGRRLSAALLCGLALLAIAPGFAADVPPTPYDRYQQALATDPDNPTLHYLRGIALLNSGRDAEALSAFRRAYPAYRDSIEANFNMSLASLRQGDLDSALLYFDQAESLGIGAQTGIYPVANLAFNLALRALDSNQPNEAIRLFHRVLAYDPQRAEVHQQLGGLYAKLGDEDLAVKAFRRHLDLVPDDPVSREFLFAIEFNRAQDAFQRGELSLAEQGFAVAHDLQPGHPAVLYYLGYLAYRHQRPGEAAMLLQETFPAADPELRTALRPLLYNTSLSLRDSGLTEPALATALLLAGQPDADGSELFLAGTLCLRAGRYSEGKALLERLLAIDPTHAGALQNMTIAEKGAFAELVSRVRSAIDAGDFTAAVEALVAAGKLRPDSPQLAALQVQLGQARLDVASRHFAAARAALTAGDHIAAGEALQQGLSICPADQAGSSLRSEILQDFAFSRDRQLVGARDALAAGRWNEAFSAFNALVTLDPALDEARDGLKAAEQGRTEELEKLMNEGRQALAGGQPEKARALFAEVLVLIPTNADGLQGLAEAERQLAGRARNLLEQGRRAAAAGKVDDARALFERARQIDDNEAARDELARLEQTIVERARLLAEEAAQASRRGDYRQAEQLYGRALALRPDHAAALEGRQKLAQRIDATIRDRQAKGDDALRRGDLPAALAAYRGVLDLAPDNAAAQSGLQRVRQRQAEQLARVTAEGERAFADGDFAAAGRAADQALRLDPYSAGAARLRERIEQARLGGARPGDEQTLYLQGVALYTKGDYVEAIRTWEAVLTLDPGFEKARQNIDKTRRKLRQIEEFRDG